MLRNVSLREKDLLIQLGIEVFLHFCVVRIQRPVHEMGDSLLRAVRVKDLKAVALLHQLVADFPERRGGFLRQECQRLLVSVDPLSHKIIGGIIADLQDGVRDGFAKEHEIRGIV